MCKGSQEEFEAVDLHESHADNDGVVDLSKELLLLDNVAERQDGPTHHPHPTICPCLDVKLLAKPWIQLSPCEDT